MSKLIIENQSNYPDAEALYYAMKVVGNGRVSDFGKSYCFATKFTNGVLVISVRNKASDRLIVQNYKEQP